MALSTGDNVPSCTLSIMGESGPAPLTTDALFGGKRVILFALPGAFTPGCSMAHLPGFVANADKIKAAGVDSIACLSVNDAFVMGAWGDAQNASEIVMVADGNGEFTDAMGLTLDATGFGMGKRSQRYAMLVDNGVITHLNVEEGPGVDALAGGVGCGGDFKCTHGIRTSVITWLGLGVQHRRSRYAHRNATDTDFHAGL